MTKLEIACFNEASAMIAAQENVDRIELCEDYSLGGITPHLGTLQKLKDQFSTPVFVMIRPRGGDFNYNEKEFEKMKSDLLMLKEAGADGFVFGILNYDNTFDYRRNLELVKLAGVLPCTFHRAFDRIEGQKKALEQVIDCGFKTVLTSGGESTAMEGLEKLKKLQEQADERITILVGGGVRASNAGVLKNNFDNLHSACIQSGTENIDVNELKNLIQELR